MLNYFRTLWLLISIFLPLTQSRRLKELTLTLSTLGGAPEGPKPILNVLTNLERFRSIRIDHNITNSPAVIAPFLEFFQRPGLILDTLSCGQGALTGAGIYIPPIQAFLQLVWHWLFSCCFWFYATWEPTNDWIQWRATLGTFVRPHSGPACHDSPPSPSWCFRRLCARKSEWTDFSKRTHPI